MPHKQSFGVVAHLAMAGCCLCGCFSPVPSLGHASIAGWGWLLAPEGWAGAACSYDLFSWFCLIALVHWALRGGAVLSAERGLVGCLRSLLVLGAGPSLASLLLPFSPESLVADSAFRSTRAQKIVGTTLIFPVIAKVGELKLMHWTRAWIETWKVQPQPVGHHS